MVNRQEEDEMRVEEIDDYDAQKVLIAKKAARKMQTPLKRL